MIARVNKALDEKQRDKGFTLIELLVVVIIIGILAAIAIPMYLNQQKSAHDAAVKADLHNAATDVAAQMVEGKTIGGTAPDDVVLDTDLFSDSVEGTPALTGDSDAFEISAVSKGGPTFTIDETGSIEETP